VERTARTLAVGAIGRGARPLDVERDDGVEAAVQPLDAVEVALEQLARADLARAQRGRERGGGAETRVRHARTLRTRPPAGQGGATVARRTSSA